MKNTLSFYKPYFKKKTDFPQCRFKNNFKKQIKVPILLKDNYLAFVFPIDYYKKMIFLKGKSFKLY